MKEKEYLLDENLNVTDKKEEVVYIANYKFNDKGEIESQEISVIIKENKKEHYELQESCPHCNESWENINDVQEWLGFNYKTYLKSISAFIKGDEFVNLKADNDIEESAGYFNGNQINELKRVLNNGLMKGKGIREISLDIDSKVKPSDLFEIVDNKIGNLIRKGDSRSIMIARTEVTRVANEGAIANYKDEGVKKVVWVASAGNRTCDICNNLDAQIFDIDNHPKIPAHTYCRCMLVSLNEVS